MSRWGYSTTWRGSRRHGPWDDSPDATIESTRYLAIVAAILTISSFIFALAFIATASRATGVLRGFYSEKYPCSRSAGTCEVVYALIEYRINGGDRQTARLSGSRGILGRLFGVGWAAPGQGIELLVKAGDPPAIIPNTFLAVFKWPFITTICGVFFAVLGYGRKTTDERASAGISDVKEFSKKIIEDLQQVRWRAVVREFLAGIFPPNVGSDAFIVTVFPLLAKVAKADGRVSPSELHAIEDWIDREFKLSPEQRRKAIEVFKAARVSERSFTEFARDCERMFHRQPGMLRLIMSCLEAIASADGAVSRAEAELLTEAREIFFGVGGRKSRSQFHGSDGGREDAFEDSDTTQNVGASASAPNGPYAVLGVSSLASPQEIKHAYRLLALQFHPDRLVSQGLPEGMREKAVEEFRKIQSAYETICAERGMK